MHKRDKKMTKKVVYLTAESKKFIRQSGNQEVGIRGTGEQGV